MPEMTAAARTLASSPRHVASARAIAMAVCRSFRYDPDAAESSALWGLCEAAMRYDPDLNDNFRAWARPRILGQIIDDFRHNRFGSAGKGPKVGSLEQPRIDRPGDQPTFLRDILPSEDDPEEDCEIREAMGAIFDALPSSHGRLMRLLYLEAATASNKERAAVAMGLCPTSGRATQLHDAAIGKIRRRRLVRLLGYEAD